MAHCFKALGDFCEGERGFRLGMNGRFHGVSKGALEGRSVRGVIWVEVVE